MFGGVFLLVLEAFSVASIVDAQYINTWAVEADGGRQEVERIAERNGYSVEGELFSDLYILHHKTLSKRSTVSDKRNTEKLLREPKVKWAKQQEMKDRQLYTTNTETMFNDDRWLDQWYLNRDGVTMNVESAWRQGYTGEGVVVAVVDDGLDYNHTEIKDNYDRQASFDVVENDADVYDSRYSSHGTKCAGVIAAVANNSKCGVGVAYQSRIGGIRLYKTVQATDAMEARALGYKRNYIDIYSNSWGPGDMGYELGWPRRLTKKALENGVKHGRRGAGSIFVFASGNGGFMSDSCAYNGYVNSVETIAISSTNWDGNVPIFAEPCSAIMAVTYSKDSFGDVSQIITSEKGGTCTGRFTGTSASAAVASGIIALTLQANPLLTWRDVQHIIVASARPIKPTRKYTSRFKKINTWVMNSAGFLVSNYFGFGLMDADKMTKYAQQWKRSPKPIHCQIKRFGAWNILSNAGLNLPLILTANETESCEGIQFLEHVEVEVSLNFTRRGDLQLDLTSPSGTRSTILHPRYVDSLTGRRRLLNWKVSTLHFWRENANAQRAWTFHFKNAKQSRQNTGFVWKLVLFLHGTREDPLEGIDVNLPKATVDILKKKSDCQDTVNDCEQRYCSTGSRVMSSYSRRSCPRSCKYCTRSGKDCKDVFFNCLQMTTRIGWGCDTSNGQNLCCDTCKKKKACKDTYQYCASLIKVNDYGCGTSKGQKLCCSTCMEKKKACKDTSEYCASLIKVNDYGCGTSNGQKLCCSTCMEKKKGETLVDSATDGG